jgi:hypothetical protein
MCAFSKNCAFLALFAKTHTSHTFLKIFALHAFPQNLCTFRAFFKITAQLAISSKSLCLSHFSQESGTLLKISALYASGVNDCMVHLELRIYPRI